MNIRRTSQSRRVDWLALAVFILPPLLMLGLEYRTNGCLGELTNDARLYLSIADNAISTGHFIQTARDIEGFVVPPGVPFALLLLRLLGFTLPMITAVQGVLFGADCLLLYRTGERLFGRCGLCAPLLFALVYLRTRLYLGNIFVEHWYLFLLCLLLRLVFCEMEERKKALLLSLCGLAAVMTRPALLPVYLACLGYAALCSVRRRSAWPLLGAVAISALAFGVNLAVNYRETGEWIWLQNYSGVDFYAAFHPDAAVTRAQSGKFGDPVLTAITTDASLSMSERSRRLMALAREFVHQNPAGLLRKIILRGLELYGRSYFFVPLPALAGGIVFCRARRQADGYILLAVNLMLALLSCCGIPELRYTLPVWPLAALHLTALLAALQKRRARSPI